MRNMILPLLRSEISKALRTKLPYLGIVAVIIVSVLVFSFAGSLQSSGTVNAWAYVGFAMQGAFSDIGLIFIAIFAAMLLAEESGSGTVRMVLSSPVLRWEFFVAKVATGLFYMALMTATALLVSICLGALRSKFGDVTDSAGLIYKKREVFLNLIVAFFVSWLPLSAVVMYGIFFSAIIKKAGQAIGVVIGTLILIEAIKHIVGIDPYLFTSYQGSGWAVFNEVAQGVDYQWTPEIWKVIAVSLIYCTVFFTAGLVIFSKRDLND